MKGNKVWAGRDAEGRLVAISLRVSGISGDIQRWRREGLTVQLEDSEPALAEFRGVTAAAQ